MPGQPSPQPEEVIIQKLRLYLLKLPLALLLIVGVCAVAATGTVFIVKAAYLLIRWMIQSW